MKRGRKPLNIKNITFTMSITQAEAETLSKHGNTYQKAIRNLINEERQKDLNEAIGGTTKTAQSPGNGSQNENEGKANAASDKGGGIALALLTNKERQRGPAQLVNTLE